MRRKRYTGKQVTWKSGADPAVAGRSLPLPWHQSDSELDFAHKGKIEQRLVPGEFFTLGVALDVMPGDPQRQSRPLPVLTIHWGTYSEPVFHCGLPVIYAGTIRCDEVGKKGTLRVLRHTFIVGGGRYILFDLNVLDPEVAE